MSYGALHIFLVSLWLLQLSCSPTGGRPCSPRNFGHGSLVCECGADYCDTLEPVTLPDMGSFVKYESNKAGRRVERSEGSLLDNPPENDNLVLKLKTSQKYQKIKGFGGALTDSAAINILNLSPKSQRNLLKSYFSSEGQLHLLACLSIY
uniref:Glucosylceramidase n=1 Tax=Naja naja TaxID=35670 RepID=A0A8C7DRY8_NAJNA